MIEELKEKVLQGHPVTQTEMKAVASHPHDEALYRAAEEITKRCASKVFDMCSIINAKSGRCPEDCKWCAQSAHYRTNIQTYGIIPTHECVNSAKAHAAQGVKRFSLVTSGRRLSDSEVDAICERAHAIHAECSIEVCASLGLLSEEQLRRLYEAGISRFHCNLESAPSHFPTLCTTHTQAQKIETLQAARRVGMDICSGGIIGMGETEEQRIELAFALREHPATDPGNSTSKDVPLNISRNPTHCRPLPLHPPDRLSPLRRRAGTVGRSHPPPGTCHRYKLSHRG